MRYAILGCVVLLMAGCAGPPAGTAPREALRPTDKVPREADAIRLGQQACAPRPPVTPQEKQSWARMLQLRWRATRQGDRWDVRLPGSFADCPIYHVAIGARDGGADDCEECVIET